MSDQPAFQDETGASTGAGRENDPHAAGFTDETERLFRSHFQRVNHLHDVGFETVRPAYQAGYEAAIDPCHDGACFEDVERELHNGWVNVRSGSGEWASVRAFAEEAFRLGREHGRVRDMPAVDDEDRPSFTDPL